MPHRPHTPPFAPTSFAPTYRRRRTGLSYHQENRLKSKLRKSTPSEPWIEAQLKSALLTDDSGNPQVYRYHDTSVFPPGGPKTAMRTCPLCKIPTPPHAFDINVCLDHAEDLDHWGPSPSALAIQKLEFYNVRADLIEPELPPEDYNSLRREIALFDAIQRIPNKYRTCATSR